MSRCIQGPFGIVASQAIFDSNLSPSEFRVLAALASFAGEGKFGEWCSPKQSELADKLGFSRPTVSLAVKRLVETGYLVTRPKITKGAGKTGLEYYVRRDFQDAPETNSAPDVREIEHRKDSQQAVDKSPMLDCADVSASETPMLGAANIPPSIGKKVINTIVPPTAEPKAKVLVQSEARRFWDELRPHLSAEGRTRGKPKQLDKLLPPLLKRYGYETLLRAALRFYRETPDCKRNNGEGQPGLQVIINDGRFDLFLESGAGEAPKPKTPPTKEQLWDRRYHEWLKTDGLIWDHQKWGPAPDEPGHLGPKKARLNDYPKPAEQGVAA